MLKTQTFIFALCCCLNAHITHATFFHGGGGGGGRLFYSSPVSTHIAAPAPVAPITSFAHNNGPVFKYNLPLPAAYAALSVAAAPPANIIKYTLGPPVTTTTTTYNTYAAAPPPTLHATIGYSQQQPFTHYAAPPPPPTLPIIKYAAPQPIAAYSSTAPWAISYAAPAPVAASSYGAW